MINVRFSVVYNYDRTGELLKNGTAKIYIRAYLKGRNKYFSTNIFIKPEQWDKKNQRIIRHNFQHKLNQSIRDKIGVMEAFVYTLHENGEPVSLERLADYDSYRPIASFTAFFEEHLANPGLSTQTFRDQRQTLEKFKAFQPTVFFSQINFKLINAFDRFLKESLSKNTVAKHHKNLKKYINLAIETGYLNVNANPYLKFKVSKEPTERIYLNGYELAQLEAVEIPNEQAHLHLIKEVFLLSCYTGLRYSDISKIHRGNTIDTPQGLELHFKAQKTKKVYRQNLRKLFPSDDLYSKPEQILRKRIQKLEEIFGVDPHYKNEPLFGLSNPYINRELKVLAKLAKLRPFIQEKISMHAGRHTFGSYLAGKVQAPVLQKLMQHSKLKETMIYVHMNPDAMNQILDNVDW